VARCLALAQAWRDGGGAVVLATDAIPDPWRSRYEAEGVAIGAPGAFDADAWVIDGYDLGAEVARGRPHVRIDDRGETGDVAAVLVIDQNLGAEPGGYAQPADQLLLGPRYALLRRELVTAAGAPRPAGAADPGRRTVLVAQGGAPSEEVRAFTSAVAAALADDGVDVVVWSGADDPVPALRSADVALAAAGSTLWELCLFGVPAVVFTVAPNQVPLAAAMVGAGLALDGGAVPGTADPAAVAGLVAGLLDDPAALAARSTRLRELVDGAGAGRVAQRIAAEFQLPLA
jgi:spore coat polysaccharide biosynthesis predicted glycosyltransferase SpsG